MLSELCFAYLSAVDNCECSKTPATERCHNGICSGTVINCDDGDPCTDDLCDPAKGCVHIRKSTPDCAGK